MQTSHNPFTVADVQLIAVIKDALEPAEAAEMDERIARHANRILADRGWGTLEDAVLEAVAQVAEHFRARFAELAK